jgi:hypothetical protein
MSIEYNSNMNSGQTHENRAEMSLVCARPDRFWTAAALCRYRSPAIFKAAEGCRSPRRWRAQMEPAAVLVRKQLAECQRVFDAFALI